MRIPFLLGNGKYLEMEFEDPDRGPLVIAIAASSE